MIFSTTISQLYAYDSSYFDTEQPNNHTKNLSSIMLNDTDAGLRLLNDVDHAIIPLIRAACHKHCVPLSNQGQKSLIAGGRIFFIGAGSSGRIALQLEAYWRKLCNEHALEGALHDKVIGIIAGGISAFIRAKEGLEDSFDAGYNAIAGYNLTSHDTVFALSASGSASFVHGAAYAALAAQSACFFVTNTTCSTPAANKLCADEATSIVLDVGAQAITGSTRLQAATGTQALLALMLYVMAKNSVHSAQASSRLIDQAFDQLTAATIAIRGAIPSLCTLVEAQVACLAHPDANFRKLHDESSIGYVTHLACNASQEVVTDMVEIVPTFSVTRLRTVHEQGKREEFRVYKLDAQTNSAAWKSLLNRPLTAHERDDIQDFIIGGNCDGVHAYHERPIGAGTVVIGYIKSNDSSTEQALLLAALTQAKLKGAHTALISLKPCMDSIDARIVDTCIYLPSPSIDCVENLMLKQALNMITNAVMAKMGKVYGNYMIDLSPSNNKLIDRAVRIISQLYNQQKKTLPSPPTYDDIQAMLLQVQSYKKQEHRYMPSIVKIVLTMLLTNTSCDQAITLLQDHQENIDRIVESHSHTAKGAN